MANTDYTIEFTERDPADVLPASSAGQYRIFLDSTTGLLAAMDHLGVVVTIGGASSLAFTHNPVVLVGDSPYASTVRETVKVDPSGGAIQIDLPTAVGIAGQKIKVVNVTTDTTPITVLPNGIETINGGPSYILNTPNERVAVESDGTNWIVVG